MSCETLTPGEKAAIRARITKLEAIYDDILSGRAIKKFVDQNGEQVEYSVANASKLRSFIDSLIAMIDCGFARRYKPRPIGFVFPRQ